MGIRILVIYIYIITSSFGSLSYAEGVGPGENTPPTSYDVSMAVDKSGATTSFGSSMDYYTDPKSGAKVPNYYKVFGFNQLVPGSSYSVFQRMVNSSVPILFENNLSSISEKSSFKAMLNSLEGRQSLLRQINGLTYIAEFNQPGAKARITESIGSLIESQRSYSPNTTSTSTALITMDDVDRLKAQTEIKAALEILKGEASLLSNKAELYRQGLRIFQSAKATAKYQITHGLFSATVPDKLSLKTKLNPFRYLKIVFGNTFVMEIIDDFGKKTTVDISAPSRKSLREMKMSEISTGLKNGTVEVGRYGGPVLAAMYLFYIIDLVATYRSNPNGFLQLKKDTLSAALPMAGLSYLIGGAGFSHYTNRAIKVSATHLTNLHNSMLSHGNNPVLQKKVVDASMQGLSRTAVFLQKAFTPLGIIGGIPIAKMAYLFTKKLHACFMIMAKGDNNNYDRYERQELEKSCDRGWDIISEVFADKSTWVTIASILSSQMLITFFLNKTNLAKYGVFKNKHLKALSLKSWKDTASTAKKIVLAFRGAAVPSIYFIAQFAAFTATFYFSYFIISKGLEEIMVDAPLIGTSEKYREIMRSYNLEPDSMDYLCDEDSLMEVGKFWVNVGHFLGDKGELSCGLKLLKKYIAHQNKVNQDWRDAKTKPFTDAVSSWTTFFHKASSQYRSSYLFYRDVVEQVRVARENDLKVKFKSNDIHLSGHEPKMKLPSTVEQSVYYSAKLPLFRSSPFFGWDYRTSDDQPMIPTADFRSANVDWDAVYSSGRYKKFEIDRFKAFKDNMIPKIIDSLKSINKDLLHEKEAESIEIITANLESGLMKKISWALNAIYTHYKREVAKIPGCPTSKSFRNINSCHFSNIMFDENLYDQGIYTIDNEDKDRLVFKHSEYRPGFNMHKSKIGSKPLPIGSMFFFNYEDKLIAQGLETNYFEGKGYEYRNIVDYMVKNMICGVKVDEGERLINSGLFARKGLWPTRFKLPRLTFKNRRNFDPCSKPNKPNKESERKNWAAGWPGGHMGHGIYLYIENSNNPQENYVGVVDYLFHELSDSVVNNFDAWWDKYVKPEYETSVERFYKNEFQAKVLNDKNGWFSGKSFHNLVEKADLDDNCVEICEDFAAYEPASIGQSIKQELDTIFNYHMAPIINNPSFPVLTKYYEPEASFTQTKARNILMSQFRVFKGKYYEILNVLLGKTKAFESADLKDLYDNLMIQYTAENEILYGGSRSDGQNLRLLILSSMVRHLQYQLSVLFQADTPMIIHALHSKTIKDMESAGITGTRKENMAEMLTKYRDEILQDYNDIENRSGLMILEYNDWPTDEEIKAKKLEGMKAISPNLRVFMASHDSIYKIFESVFGLYGARLSVKPLD